MGSAIIRLDFLRISGLHLYSQIACFFFFFFILSIISKLEISRIVENSFIRKNVTNVQK